MKIYLLVCILIHSSLYAFNDLDVKCTKIYDDTTNQSLIKNTSPYLINISIKSNNLKKFQWDNQELEMHFEYIIDDNFDIKIGSMGYSDISNAVFFEIKNNLGYLYQYSKKGVNYSCQ